MLGHRWTIRVALRRLGKREVGWDKSRPAVWAVAFSLLEQQMLNVWFFSEIDQHSRDHLFNGAVNEDGAVGALAVAIRFCTRLR